MLLPLLMLMLMLFSQSQSLVPPKSLQASDEVEVSVVETVTVTDDVGHAEVETVTENLPRLPRNKLEPAPGCLRGYDSEDGRHDEVVEWRILGRGWGQRE